MPGQWYSATLYRGPGLGQPSCPAFEGLKLAPGEVRDLGDVRLGAPIDADLSPGWARSRQPLGPQ